MAMDEKGLGQRLQAARRAAGLTQQTLCEKANISYSTLAKIERGAIRSPSIFTIQSLVVALGISLDELLGIGKAAEEAVPAGVSKNGIKFVYFDVNGCLIHFFQRAFTSLARDTGAAVDDIERVYWKYNAEVCRGQMSIDDFNTKLSQVVGGKEVDWQAYYLDSVEPIPGMAEGVRWAADQGYRVGLLTNIMPDFLPALLARGLLPDVEYSVIIDSSEVGAIKPEQRIFEIAAERANAQGSEILFVDDDTPNIMTADRLGWHVISCDEYEPEDTVLRLKEVLELTA
jgi:FMN phosphatase YigB (HAD superfamily)